MIYRQIKHNHVTRTMDVAIGRFKAFCDGENLTVLDTETQRKQHYDGVTMSELDTIFSNLENIQNEEQQWRQKATHSRALSLAN